MKFLCIACNTQMKLIKDPENVVADEKGSLSVKWECPDCLYEMGMLTNSFETQLVSSIGVEIGGSRVKNPATSGTSEALPVNAPKTTSAPEPKCPFPESIRDAMMGSAREGGMVEGLKGDGGSQVNSHGKNEAEQMKSAMGFGSENKSPDETEVTWTAQAMVRLQNIPEFIRPVAKKGIEKFARDGGKDFVDETVLDAAKDHFNM